MKAAIGVALTGAVLFGCGGNSVNPRLSAQAGASTMSDGGGGSELSNAGTTAAGAPASGGGDSGITTVIVGQHPLALAVDDTYLYWQNATSTLTTLQRCAKADCKDVTQLYEMVIYADKIEVVGDLVWTRDRLGSSVVACSRLGCPEGPRVVLQGLTADNQNDVGGDLSTWTTDGTQLAWANEKQVRICPAAQCTKDTSVALVDFELGYVSALAIRGDKLYGILANATVVPDVGPLSEVFALPLESPKEFAILTQAIGEGPLALDDGHLFWVDAGEPRQSSDGLKPPPPTLWDSGRVSSVSFDGATSTQLARYQQWYATSAIAADRTGVYWSDGVGAGNVYDGTSSHLVRATVGADAQPEELATLGSPSASGIALDSQYVYWGDATLGAIIKRAK